MAFRMKNLLILDRCTEELCILDTISHYEYNRLFYERNKLETVVESNLFILKILNNISTISSTIYKRLLSVYQKESDHLFGIFVRSI